MIRNRISVGFAGLSLLTLAVWLYLFQGVNIEQYFPLSEKFQSTQQTQDTELPIEETNSSTEELGLVDLVDRSKLVISRLENYSVALQIGMSANDIRHTLGNPERVEPSAYGYEWWVYPDYQGYIQIGIKDDQVVTLFTNVPSWQIYGISPGSSFEDIKNTFSLSEEISLKHGLGFYTFVLTETDLREKPLSIVHDVGIQFYLDIHEGQKLSSIRLMDIDTLLSLRPYSIKYIGHLPAPPELTEEEELAVNRANERQIFDLTNNIRQRYGLGELKWDDLVADVARSHSQDMYKYDFFDHTSPNTGELGDRLIDWEVYFLSAGENIAWNYLDGIDAHEGWMNSLGHRINILQEHYNVLGVGVVHRHYTQNFLMR